LLAFGHRVGYLPFDVGRALRLPAVRSRLAERILPEADVHRILSLETNERNHALLLLLYASGVRVSEVGGLYWRDVQANGDGAQITVFGKGGKTRAIQLPASVATALPKLRGEAGEDDPGRQPLTRIDVEIMYFGSSEPVEQLLTKMPVINHNRDNQQSVAGLTLPSGVL